jgi:uncharacterized protein (TIGR02145 family)
MKTLAKKFALPAMAFSLLLSCSFPSWVPFFGEDEEEKEEKYKYCVLVSSEICFPGPFTECKGDGFLSNDCPFSSGNDQGNTLSSSGGESSSSINSSSSIEDNSSSTNSSSSLWQSNHIYGSPITYGGETYQTVVIGTQTWMARNLNYNESGSKCYNNNPANCATYGRLYDWATAWEICPSGWHLPSNDEWYELTDVVGGQTIAGRYLKTTSGWNNNGNGMDDYGFSALPGGRGGSDGSFYDVGSLGYWWSSSEFTNYFAYERCMYYDNEGVYWKGYDKNNLFSVRCVKN